MNSLFWNIELDFWPFNRLSVLSLSCIQDLAGSLVIKIHLLVKSFSDLSFTVSCCLVKVFVSLFCCWVKCPLYVSLKKSGSYKSHNRILGEYAKQFSCLEHRNFIYLDPVSPIIGEIWNKTDHSQKHSLREGRFQKEHPTQPG